MPLASTSMPPFIASGVELDEAVEAQPASRAAARVRDRVRFLFKLVLHRAVNGGPHAHERCLRMGYSARGCVACKLHHDFALVLPATPCMNCYTNDDPRSRRPIRGRMLPCDCSPSS